MKILIVKIGAIGDVVMATAMLPAIKKKYPDASVSWIVGQLASPVLRMVEGIDEVISVDEKKLLKGTFIQKVQSMLQIWKILFLQKFDLIIDGHPDSRYAYIYLPVRKDVVRKLQSGSERRRPVPGRHHSDEYALLALGEDGPNDHLFKVPAISSFSEISPFLKISDKAKVVVLAPGGAKNLLRDDYLRRWPLESYVALAKELIKENFHVVLTGSESDLWILDLFKEVNVLDLVGKLTLQELVQVIQSADLLITHDSGPLHFSALVQIPVVAIFGPTNPYEKVPRIHDNIILWGGRNLSCRPCYDGRNYAPCQNNLCIQEVTVEEVLRNALAILQKEKSIHR